MRRGLSTINRRNFISKGSLLVGAALFLRPHSLCFGTASAPRLSAAERTALRFVAQYGSDTLIASQVRAAAQAGSAQHFTKLVVRVRSLQALREAFSRARANGIRHGSAKGNFIRIQVCNHLFETENLLPALYAERVAELGQPGNSFRQELIICRAASA
jgi:hypothetical protein